MFVVNGGFCIGVVNVSELFHGDMDCGGELTLYFDFSRREMDVVLLEDGECDPWSVRIGDHAGVTDWDFLEIDERGAKYEIFRMMQGDFLRFVKKLDLLAGCVTIVTLGNRGFEMNVVCRLDDPLLTVRNCKMVDGSWNAVFELERDEQVDEVSEFSLVEENIVFGFYQFRVVIGVVSVIHWLMSAVSDVVMEEERFGVECNENFRVRLGGESCFLWWSRLDHMLRFEIEVVDDVFVCVDLK